MSWDAVKITKLAIGNTHIGGIRIAVDDPGYDAGRDMVPTHAVAHLHELGGAGIFKKKNAFFGAKPFHSEGALEQIRNIHLVC